MQYVDRSTEPPPQTLLGSVPSMLRRKLYAFMDQSADRRAQSYPSSGSLNYKQGGMQQALERLFNGRCAFCESITRTEIHQFRPVGEALPYAKSEYAHLYYCWLELAWQNFYPVCESCWPDEVVYFPVAGARAPIPDQEVLRRHMEHDNGLWPADAYPPKESPLLLDPCQDKGFHQHMWIGMEGKLQGISRRGSETISHFHLNADALVQARRNAHIRYLGKIRHTLQYQSANKIPENIFKFEELEFGGTWYLLLRNLLSIMAKKTGTRPSSSRKNIGRSLVQLSARRDGFGLFDVCVLTLERLTEAPVATPRMPLRRPSRARLLGVEIKNFKSIERLQLQLGGGVASLEGAHRTPALVILGENATGKSSILEAITMALASPEARDKLNIADRELILAPDHFGEFDVRPQQSASVTLHLDEDGQAMTRQLYLGLGAAKRAVDPSEEGIPVFAYGAFRKFSSSSRTGSVAKHIRNLFDASDLPNPEKWLLGLGDENFAMVTRALRTIFSIEGEFEIIIRDRSEGACFLVSAVDEQGQPISVTPLRTASSGFRSVLAMACDVMRGMMDRRFNPSFDSLYAARGVVLIDEIESHLHPRWKIAIVSAMRQALPNVTFIATTHDPLCLRGMGDDEVVVLRRTRLKQGRTASGMRSQVEVLENLPAISNFRIEQLLTSDMFQLNSTDDPEIEAQMSKIADLLASNDLDGTQERAVDAFKRDIAAAMPIGTSEAQRLVQEAVAEYLQERVQQQADQMSPRREQVKKRIIEALRGVA